MNNLSSDNAATLRELKEFFISRSVPAFLVGGYLRDTLRDAPSMDIDIAVQADSLSLAKDLAKALPASYVPLSPSHKVARITVPSAQGGNGWVIDISSIESSIFDDLARRDFSVDALALALEEWGTPSWQDSILDPFGGKLDLSQGVIRAIKPSVFQEDPARLLRGVRLAAKLGFRIDPSTTELITRDAHLISSTAGERVRDEFLAILSLDGAKVHLETLDELGLLCYNLGAWHNQSG
jgi:tRNA nucleotidyltransferase/poly(A) polymerase